MFLLLKRGLIFIKKNPALLVSLLLIVIIPLLIFFLSSYLTKNFQENIDLTLQREALTILNVLAPHVYDYYENPEVLQKRMQGIVDQNLDLSHVKVFLPTKDDKFKTIASSDVEDQETMTEKTSLVLAWNKDQAIAFLSREKGVRHWSAIKPFYGPDGRKIGLISLSLSLEQIDALVVREMERAYLIALVSIVFILFLIIQHTHLFRYVSLFNKAREIDKIKDNFMNMAVHELRSPVVNIKNYLLEIKERIFHKLEPSEQEDLSRVEASVSRLNTLITDVLEVIKIEQGNIAFQNKAVVPVEIINATRQELFKKAEKRGLIIKFDENKNKDVKIKADPERLKEVLYNLIDNAIKYAKQGEGGEIILDTKKDTIRRKFYILVEDTGIGISAEEQKRLFQRFYRIKNRETSDVEGTGLGLWIVKRLCKKMKAEILMESIKGVGTKFIIIFPLS